MPFPSLHLARLFGRRKDEAAKAGFTPTTELASQILNRPAVRKIAPNARGNPSDETPLDGVETRASRRFVPLRTKTTLTTDKGKTIRARIINVSASGVAVEPEAKDLDPHSVVMVGEKKVRPGRKITGGLVFLFDRALDPSRSGPDIVL